VATAYRTPTFLRRAAFWVAAIASTAVVVVVSTTMLDQFSRSTERTTNVVTGVSNLDVEIGRGEVDVVAVPGRTVRVHETRESGIVRTGGSSQLTGRTLRLDGGCDLGFAPLTCEVRYRVEVPARTNVTIHTGAGAVEVRGIRGDLTVKTGVGQVDATGIASRRVELGTGVGQARARLVRPPAELLIETGVGDTEVAVPDVGYRIDEESGVGEVSVRVRRDDRSARRIRIRSGVGDARVVALRR
jgi:hypothetical protein